MRPRQRTMEDCRVHSHLYGKGSRARVAYTVYIPERVAREVMGKVKLNKIPFYWKFNLKFIFPIRDSHKFCKLFVRPSLARNAWISACGSQWAANYFHMGIYGSLSMGWANATNERIRGGRESGWADLLGWIAGRLDQWLLGFGGVCCAACSN